MRQPTDPAIPQPPRLNDAGLVDLAALPAEPEFENVALREEAAWPTYARTPWKFDGCKLERCTFSGLDLSKAMFWDSRHDHCDFSGVKSFYAGVLRTTFTDCRLTGWQLASATLKDVTFKSCKMDTATFRMAKMMRVVFDDCILNDTDFNGGQLSDVVFTNCELRRTDFSQTQLQRVDLSGSILSEIRGVLDLKGAIIGVEQTIQLAPLFCMQAGIVVKT